MSQHSAITRRQWWYRYAIRKIHMYLLRARFLKWTEASEPDKQAVLIPRSSLCYYIGIGFTSKFSEATPSIFDFHDAKGAFPSHGQNSANFRLPPCSCAQISGISNMFLKFSGNGNSCCRHICLKDRKSFSASSPVCLQWTEKQEGLGYLRKHWGNC